MKIIAQNPFRTVGILVNATSREKEKQIRRLTKFLEAGQEPDEDFSFPILGQLNRSPELVADAAARLNLNDDRIQAAMFWFYNGSFTDEPAFNALKEANISGCEIIWSKKTSSTEVTEINCSAFQNLSTLNLSKAVKSKPVNLSWLEEGIRLKLHFLQSDHATDFVSTATDETYRKNKEGLQNIFLNCLHRELAEEKIVTTEKFIELVSRISFVSKQNFLKGFAQEPISAIEKKINEANNQRTNNKANSNEIGARLYEETKPRLYQVRTLLGESDIKYQTLADKVVDEILQCAHSYFKHFEESPGTSAAQSSLTLVRNAKSIAVGNVMIQRCESRKSDLDEWIDEAPERERQRLIQPDLEGIMAIVEEFESKNAVPPNL